MTQVHLLSKVKEVEACILLQLNYSKVSFVLFMQRKTSYLLAQSLPVE